MSSPDKLLEEQLAEVGKRLLDPPPSTEDLVPLLNKAEYYPSRVCQSPGKSTERALSPCVKALAADKLFKHTDIDIKVAVASCIKVRSCVVMLDLECDVLILQMVQHFLKAIRDYHPEHVFSSWKRL